MPYSCIEILQQNVLADSGKTYATILCRNACRRTGFRNGLADMSRRIVCAAMVRVGFAGRLA